MLRKPQRQGPRTIAELSILMEEAGRRQLEEEAKLVRPKNHERILVTFTVTRYDEGPQTGLFNLHMTTYDKKNKKETTTQVCEGVGYEIITAKMDIETSRKAFK